MKTITLAALGALFIASPAFALTPSTGGGGTGGWYLNGVATNGIKLQGIKLQGIKLQGVRANGWHLNGASAHGIDTITSGVTIKALTLPRGRRIDLR